MNENTPDESEIGSKPLVKKVDDTPFDLVPDIYLRFLSYLAVLGFKIGVTLQVKGVVITGMIISHKEYVEKMNALLKSTTGSWSPESKEFYGSLIDKLFTDSDTDEPLTDGNPQVELDDIYHIHLADARIVPGVPSAIYPRNDGTLWRSKLIAVDGFFIGNVSLPE